MLIHFRLSLADASALPPLRRDLPFNPSFCYVELFVVHDVDWLTWTPASVPTSPICEQETRGRAERKAKETAEREAKGEVLGDHNPASLFREPIVRGGTATRVWSDTHDEQLNKHSATGSADMSQ